MLRLHSASHSKKGADLPDNYENLGANWSLSTFMPMKKLLFFFSFETISCASQQSWNWDRFIHWERLTFTTLSSWKVEGRMNWINISKEKIFAMFPQDRKYNIAFQTEKAGAQKETPMVLLCTSLCLCLSSILWTRQCLVVFNYVYEAQDGSQHLLLCLLG